MAIEVQVINSSWLHMSPKWESQGRTSATTAATSATAESLRPQTDSCTRPPLLCAPTAVAVVPGDHPAVRAERRSRDAAATGWHLLQRRLLRVSSVNDDLYTHEGQIPHKQSPAFKNKKPREKKAKFGEERGQQGPEPAGGRITTLHVRLRLIIVSVLITIITEFKDSC